MRATLGGVGADLPLGSFEQFEAFIADEKHHWDAVITKAGITWE